MFFDDVIVSEFDDSKSETIWSRHVSSISKKIKKNFYFRIRLTKFDYDISCCYEEFLEFEMRINFVLKSVLKETEWKDFLRRD
jgi:hypothetical protein